MKAELRGNTISSPLSIQNPNSLKQSSSPLTGALKVCLGSLDAACIEKLLLHCASALEANDVTLAQQVMWVLNNVASAVGDPNQRLTSWFLRALIFRASRVSPTPLSLNGTTTSTIQRKLMTVTELAGYVDLIPWHRFGFCASNSIIYKAILWCPKVHIIDFSITHCMQWPTLIDALAKRSNGPPSLRITVPFIRPLVPPLVNMSIEEVGIRLGNFANYRDVLFEFNVFGVPSCEVTPNDFSHFDVESLLNHLSNPTLFNVREDEAMVINCQNWIRYLPDDLKDTFLNIIKRLNPRVIVIVDEDCDLNTSSLTSRITTCFNYLWIPFDALETFSPKESNQRVEYETDIGKKIESIIGCEGVQRLERLESGNNMSQRLKKMGLLSEPFCDETIKEVKMLLDEHASGWGMKREDDMLVLTWKGHNAIYATAWVTNNSNNNKIDFE